MEPGLIVREEAIWDDLRRVIAAAAMELGRIDREESTKQASDGTDSPLYLHTAQQRERCACEVSKQLYVPVQEDEHEMTRRGARQRRDVVRGLSRC
jgi:hypothetical protein